jgi:hypothetical protein
MHGGHVVAHSEGEGRGCRFDVYLPSCTTLGEAHDVGASVAHGFDPPG